MTTYIPYSTRHNITNTDIAGLLDYLERVMGWDIEFYYDPCTSFNVIRYEGWMITLNTWDTMSLWHDEHVQGVTEHRLFLYDFRKDIFFRTYRTLLPAIRDLYSK